MTAMLWISCVNPPGHDRPLWQRSAFVADDGTVYVPAALTDDRELAVVLKAAWDGNVSLVFQDGHYFLPARWIAVEYPEVADLCDLIERRVREVTGREGWPRWTSTN
jgi:hypothetical protein